MIKVGFNCEENATQTSEVHRINLSTSISGLRFDPDLNELKKNELNPFIVKLFFYSYN